MGLKIEVQTGHWGRQESNFYLDDHTLHFPAYFSQCQKLVKELNLWSSNIPSHNKDTSHLITDIDMSTTLFQA